MQIVENSDLGLRVARLSMASVQSRIEFTLFPMIHVGEHQFFQAVYDDAFSHDVVLVEGVRSPITRRLTRSYRWIEGSKRLNLCVQPPYPRPPLANVTVVHADVSQDEFSTIWRTVPLWLRAACYVVPPLIGLRYRWLETRETLARRLPMDDLPRREETLSWEPETAALTDAIVTARDKHLLKRISEQLDQPDEARRVAVVYGAAHMRAVVRALADSHGYYAREAAWLTVFSPTTAMSA
jgi:hypothetical protein